MAALSRTQTVGEVVDAMIKELASSVGGTSSSLPSAAASSLPAPPPFTVPAERQQSSRLVIQCPTAEGTNGFLDAHVIRNRRVLPMTVATGHMAAAVLQAYQGYYLEAVQDVQLFSGIDVDSNVEVSLEMKRDVVDATGAPRIVVACMLKKHGGKRPAPAYGAKVVLTATQPPPPMQPARAQWRSLGGARLSKGQMYDGRTLFHGPMLQGIKTVVDIDDAGLKADAVQVPLSPLQAGQFSGAGTVVDGFAADVMLQAMLVWARHKHGKASLPAQMGALEWYRRLPKGGDYCISLQIDSSDASSATGTCYFHDSAGCCFLIGRGLKVVLNDTLEYTIAPQPAPPAPKAATPKAATPSPTTRRATRSSAAAAPTEPVDQRLAVVGIAVKYAGAPDLNSFWEMLCADQRGVSEVSAERLKINSKSSHLAPNGGLLGADGIINDSYGQISGVRSEHELLLALTRDALADAGSPDVAKRCGIVSGCLSFPRDGMQRL